ncbi:TniQ family protein [Rhodopseudomonas sp. NSM]|uniref:TniQ family protein n=1 Tax=Rhodopseudomonas sp. NSM TaxID=3457630 RepID=UPI00403585BC
MLRSSLPLWVVPAEDEPPHGLLLRLAERNGIQSQSQLSVLTGLSVRELRNGAGIERLAAVAHCDPAHLMNSAPIVSDGGLAIRGERFSARHAVRQSARRLCPECVVESSHHRFWFDLEFVTTCPAHGRKLIQTCSCGQPLSWTDVRISKCCRCDNGDVTNIPWIQARPDILEMDRWILSRLRVGGVSSVPLLDSMNVGTALHVIQNVGLLDLGGYQTAWPEPRDFGVSVAEVRSRGFRILRLEQLNEVVDRVYVEFVATNSGRAATIKNAYGWFGEWLLDLQFQEASARIYETIVVRATRRKRSQPSFRSGWGLGHST